MCCREGWAPPRSPGPVTGEMPATAGRSATWGATKGPVGSTEVLGVCRTTLTSVSDRQWEHHRCSRRTGLVPGPGLGIHLTTEGVRAVTRTHSVPSESKYAFMF